jgi:spermidine/putrescine-binding protein
MGRREFFGLAGRSTLATGLAFGGFSALLAACAGDGISGVTLDYMGLEGEDAIGEAEAWRTENDVELQSRYVAGVDEVIALLSAGTIADIATSGNADVKRLAQAGLITPIDTGRLENWDDLAAKLRDGDFIRHEGDVYAVPFAWGDEPYIFVPERLPRDEIPNSVLGMQDPKWNGRIITLDSIWLLFGLVSRELYPDRPTDLSLDEFARVVDETRPIVDNMVAIAGGYGDATDYLVRGEADISLNGWEAQLTFAADKGVTVDFGFFDTSTLVWCDSYVLPESAEDVDTAYAYMDEVISPETNAVLATNLISGAANTEAADLVPADIKALFDYTAVTDLNDPRDVTNWLPPAEPAQGRAGQQDWTDAWLEMKA